LKRHGASRYLSVTASHTKVNVLGLHSLSIYLHEKVWQN